MEDILILLGCLVVIYAFIWALSFFWFLLVYGIKDFIKRKN